MPNKCLTLILVTLVSFALTLTACGQTTALQPSQPSIPTVSFKGPESGSTFQTGEAVVIRFSARDVEGVSQVELLANGSPIMVQPVEPAVNAFSGQHSWTPTVMGSYVIELRAFSVNGNISETSQLFLTIEQAAVSPTDTPTAIPASPTPTLVVATDTPELTAEVTPTVEIPTETPTSTPTSTPAATADPSLVVVADAVFVRAGPGTNYTQVGRLVRDDIALITGRDANPVGWWQIIDPADNQQRVWVSADGAFTVASNADGVAVVEAPPPDTQPASAPTPTPPPADSPLPVIFEFVADKQTVRAGEPVRLSWSLENATEAYLQFGGTQEGVISPGERTVFPTAETVYTLIARNDAGEVSLPLTIAVDTSAPLLSVPAIYYFTASTFEVNDDDDDVTLRWDLANATEAFLEAEDDTDGVVAPGERTVSINNDETFKLIVRNDNGLTTSELRLTFGDSPASDGESTPAINHFGATSLLVNRGDQITLNWDVANAREAYLIYQDVNKGVISPGTETTTVSEETVYRLEVSNNAGRSVAELRVRVR